MTNEKFKYEKGIVNMNLKKERTILRVKFSFINIILFTIFILLISSQNNCRKSEEKTIYSKYPQLQKILDSIPADINEITNNPIEWSSILAALKYGSGKYNNQTKKYEYQISDPKVVLALAKNSKSIQASENELTKDLDVNFSFTIINVQLTKYYQKFDSVNSRIQFYLNMNVEVCGEDCSMNTLNDILCFSSGDYLKVTFSLNEQDEPNFSEITFSNPKRKECNYIFVYSDGDR
jgi:hypothetical protein